MLPPVKDSNQQAAPVAGPNHYVGVLIAFLLFALVMALGLCGNEWFINHPRAAEVFNDCYTALFVGCVVKVERA
jgi:threonine/homoserine/homoserine lactone efflux protein